MKKARKSCKISFAGHLPVCARRGHARRRNVYSETCSYGKIRHFTGFYGISERSPVALHAEIVVICSIFFLLSDAARAIEKAAKKSAFKFCKGYDKGYGIF